MANFNEILGIRYGVISPHSVGQDSEYDLYEGPNSTDPYYESGKKELEEKIDSFFQDIGNLSDEIRESLKDQIITEWFEGYENPDGAMDYSDKEYDLHVSGDNFGIFVMRSPYYTYCRGCSPCAPGAGDLDSPIDKDSGSFDADPYLYRALCLGPEWFDKEESEYSKKIPYRVFRVDNDQEVQL
jgi:hypothetical protein